MSRPSEYSNDILAAARGYLEQYEERGQTIPTVAGLATALGVARSTVYRWAGDDDKAEFGAIVERVLCTQEVTLVDKGLRGEFNPALTKMLLSKHGYADKHELGPNTGSTMTVSWISPDSE